MTKMTWTPLDIAKISCPKAGKFCLDGINLYQCRGASATPEPIENCKDGCTPTPLAMSTDGKGVVEDFCSIKCEPRAVPWGGSGYCIGRKKSRRNGRDVGFKDGHIYGCAPTDYH